MHCFNFMFVHVVMAVFVFSIQGVQPAFASNCTSIPLTPVEPSAPMTEKEVKEAREFYRKQSGSALNVSLAEVNVFLDHFKSDPFDPDHPLLLISSTDEQQEREISRLNTAEIREFMKLWIQARQMNGKNPCEPLPVYARSNSPILGMGPALVPDFKYSLDGKKYGSLMVLENALMPKYDWYEMLTIDSLQKNSYYSTVVVHELAHALTVELFSKETYEKIDKHTQARMGHFASQISDLSVAWLEGLAEGFENYFSQKYLPLSKKIKFPVLGKNFSDIGDRLQSGKSGMEFVNFIKTAFNGAGQALYMATNMPQFTTEFLLSERTLPIEFNAYVWREAASNIGVGLGVESLLVPQTESVGIAKDRDTFRKEGMVAYLIKEILEQGLFEDLVRTIINKQPSNVYEFLEAIRDSWPVEKQKKIAAPISAFFDHPIREKYDELNRKYLPAMYKIDILNKKMQQAVYLKYKVEHEALKKAAEADGINWNNLNPVFDAYIEFPLNGGGFMGEMNENMIGKMSRLNLDSFNYQQLNMFQNSILIDSSLIAEAKKQEPKSDYFVGKVDPLNSFLFGFDEKQYFYSKYSAFMNSIGDVSVEKYGGNSFNKFQSLILESVKRSLKQEKAIAKKALRTSETLTGGTLEIIKGADVVRKRDQLLLDFIRKGRKCYLEKCLTVPIQPFRSTNYYAVKKKAEEAEKAGFGSMPSSSFGDDDKSGW